MSQILYEQYKDALRRGHVAALRGRLDQAVAAYEAAAAIAPDRALPHSSLASVLERLGRLDAAEAAYAAALQRAPSDEAALRGRAELHAGRGNRLDAARDYEALAESLEQAGRLVDACDAARRALELAESRTRRRTVERLTAVLREQDADPSVAEALERAMQLLEPMHPTPPAAPPAQAEAGTDGQPAGNDGSTQAGHRAETAPPEEPALDPVAALLEAEGLLEARQVAAARDILLALARQQRTVGRLDSALDACLTLMAIDPSDTVVQLEIAANQVARGWSELATEKVRLLARLAALNADQQAANDVTAFAVQHGLHAADAEAASSTGAQA
jgi:tetratricopeptide (TPR) repeat protein